MTELSREILANWQVRKTKAQKTAFIDFLQAHIPGLRVEEKGKNRNLVLGDVKSAKIILTAHYDTCSRVPFPNFITPKNFLVYLLYNLIVVAPFLALMGLVWWLVSLIPGGEAFAPIAGYAAMMASMFGVLMGGPANEHTANDNTSGVITLCQLIDTMTPAQKEKVCFVFFDNEEAGLRGSGYFARLHRKDGLKDKLLLNFDCVSDGDIFLLVHNKPAGKQYGQAISDAFQPTGEKEVEICASSKAFYPSDQSNFPVNAAVAAMRRHKLVGLYMDKIHTKRDTVFQEENIRYLTDATVKLVDSI